MVELYVGEKDFFQGYWFGGVYGYVFGLQMVMEFVILMICCCYQYVILDVVEDDVIEVWWFDVFVDF